MNQPIEAKPPPEEWDEPNRPRPNWAPYELPNSAIRMIEGEQLLQQLGVRDIVAGLGSASVIDFQNGLVALKRVFIEQYDGGFKDGQANVLDHAPSVFSTTSIVVFVTGVAVGSIMAALVFGILST